MDAASAHITSLDQLDAMLSSGRISEEDYAVLRQAVVGPPSTRIPTPESAPVPLPARRPRWGKSWKNRQVGGVCGGIAEAMEINAWTLRLVFLVALLFTGGSALFVYILLYFVLPWKEDEAHLVWRFPAGFVFTAFVLWMLFMAASVRFAPPFRLNPIMLRLHLPVGFGWVSNAYQFLFSGAGIVSQLIVFAFAFLIYAMAPPHGTARKATAWIVCGGLVLACMMVALLYWSGAGRSLL